jgi:hypothetical protein
LLQLRRSDADKVRRLRTSGQPCIGTSRPCGTHA